MKLLNNVARVVGKSVVKSTDYMIGSKEKGDGLLREIAMSYHAGKAGASAPKEAKPSKYTFSEEEIKAYAASKGWDI